MRDSRPLRATVYKAPEDWTYDLVQGSWADLRTFHVVDLEDRWFDSQADALAAALARLKEEASMPESEPCAWLLYGGSPASPAEYCEDEAVDGEPYCAEHGRLADG